MISVVPLRYDTVFKKAFSKPDIFCQFVHDVLGIEIQVDRVITGRRFPEPVSYVDIEYDLFAEDTEKRIIVEIQHVQEVDFFDRFLYYHIIGLAEQIRTHTDYQFNKTVYTLVVLTGSPRRQENNINFSYVRFAQRLLREPPFSNMDPINEFGDRLNVYSHRLVFLNPRLRNEKTPESTRVWLELINDSMDEKVNEEKYYLPIFQKVIEEIKIDNITPQELKIIKDEAAWERTVRESFEEGRRREKEQIALSMLQKGMDIILISEMTGLKLEEIEAIKPEEPMTG
jgi:predicted transposase/invertase (TIGR01784 family)